MSTIDAKTREFIARQHVFFVATAPLSADGHVNLSPKGLDSFRVLDAQTVIYLDITGSGNETAAHVAENGRLTIMFCAFEGQPKILRLYCHGRVVTPRSPDWTALISRFPAVPGTRQVIVGDVYGVQSSCGFGVPRLSFVEHRDQLTTWAAAKGEQGLVEYRRAKNAISLDGLLTPETER